MYNGSTRQGILQEVLERLSLHGLRVRWSNSEKELARVQNVSVDNPSRLSRSFTASVTRGGRVILWNEGRTVSFPEYVRRVKNVMRVEDVRIEELLSEFSENGSYSSLGADPEKIKRAFERIKGYEISDELAYGLSEYGVMVLLRESFDEDREFIRNKLNQEGYREVAERLFTRFERDPREFILVPMKADNEITGFYVRWRTFTETDLKHEYISVSRNLRMKLGSGRTKTVILTEGVIDALMVYMHNPDDLVLMRSGWMEVLEGLFYVEDNSGNKRLRKDIKDFEIILAFDKDRAGEGYAVDVVESYGFVSIYEWEWEGQEDIDEALVKGKQVLPKPAVRFYVRAFQEELKERNYMPACVRLFSQEEGLVDNLSEEEVKVLLGLFPKSRALRNYAFAFGLDVGKIKRTYSFCNSGLLSQFCPLQKCVAGKGIIVGKLELEAVEPTEREYRISVYRVEENGEIEQEILYTKLKDLEKDITGTAGLLKLKEPVKSIALEILGKQAKQIAKGRKEVKEDFTQERLIRIIKDILASINTWALKDEEVWISYDIFVEKLKTHSKYRRGDYTEMLKRKLIRKTSRMENDKVVNIVAVPKEFIAGMEEKFSGIGESVGAKLKEYAVHIATREEIASGKVEHFVDRNLAEVLDELRKGKVVVITTGEEDFEWFTLDMPDMEIQEYLKRYRDEGIYYVAVAMKNGVLHKVDLNERPIEIEKEEDLGETIGF